MRASVFPVAFATLAAAAGPLAAHRRSEFAVGPFTACSLSDAAQTSCRNTTAIQDDCCIETRGGMLLLTQFWDPAPSTAPSAAWTVHGLWPDRCDGTYEGYCDPTREVTAEQITAIIKRYGGHNLLRYMRRYWPDHGSVTGSLWAHEYNKHATCFSSGRPQCYSYGAAAATADPQKDVADYFYRTVELSKSLDTYAALKAAGVVPSRTRKYTLEQIQGAIKARFGVAATLGCTKGTNELAEVWYHFHVKGGNVYNGEYLPIDGGKSFCNATGIVYPPKQRL